MKLEYSFRELLKKHQMLDIMNNDVMVSRLASEYKVHKKTVLAWLNNDKVPTKYMVKEIA